MPPSTYENISSPELDVELINNWKAFEAIRSEYDQFINGEISTASQPYQFEWMAAVKPLNIEAKMKPYFLIIRDAGKLVGFAPLMRQENPWFKGWFTRLRIWGEHEGSMSNVLPDFISVTGMEESIIRSIRDYLFGEGKHDWDLFEFRYYSESNISYPIMEKYFPSAKWQDEGTDCFTIIFPKEKEELFSQVSSKRLSDFRRRERRLKEAYPDITFNCHTEINEELFSQIAEVHLARQQDLRGDGRERFHLFDDPVQKKVMWDFMKASEKENWLRIYTIETSDELIAFNLIFQQTEMSVSLLIAFDQKYGNFAPSFILLKYSIETEFELGETKELNMLSKKTTFKEIFSNETYRKFQFRQINDRNLMSGIRISLWALLRIPVMIRSKLM